MSVFGNEKQQNNRRKIKQIMTDEKGIRGLNPNEVWNYENGFYWFSHRARINKFIAHYELYKTILGLPGDVLELGVYKSASLIRFATFRGLLENDFSRKIFGFDAFGSFPKTKLTLDDDLHFIDTFQNNGGAGLEKEQVEKILFDKGFDNVELIKGNVFDTLPVFLKANPATRISILHLDLDVKEPTEFALDILYEKLVPNGLIIVDDYGSVAGATDAFHEFSKKRGLLIEKLNNYSTPAYIRKPC